MAKFNTIVQQVEAEQWTKKNLPKSVTQKPGIDELGFVIGADGKRRDCKQGDFIVSEVGGAYPMEEKDFTSRYELAEAPVPVPAVQTPPVVPSDTQGQSDPVTEEVKDAEVQS